MELHESAQAVEQASRKVMRLRAQLGSAEAELDDAENARRAQVVSARLIDPGRTNASIGRQFGVNESTVRKYLKKSETTP
jgi:DNA-binding NarL/FixJ family response regulator